MSQEQQKLSRAELIEGIHYYINDMGYWVFTEIYHQMRGYCCKQKCKHCPYGNAPSERVSPTQS
ncbi:MAG: DUF5522 domain-containing protein [Bacteroidia bacterium]|jgi:hypothetical protein|nr:DUF5522 domain-containing protein [Bacteroidia bacterium]